MSDAYRDWVRDLDGGVIKCVYCGHHYEPANKVPATLADVVNEHIEQCPEHPMSALKARAEQAERERGEAESALKKIFELLLPVTNTADSTTVGMVRKAVAMLDEEQRDRQEADARANEVIIELAEERARLMALSENCWWVRRKADPRTSWEWAVVSIETGALIATGDTMDAAIDAARRAG